MLHMLSHIVFSVCQGLFVFGRGLVLVFFFFLVCLVVVDLKYSSQGIDVSVTV